MAKCIFMGVSVLFCWLKNTTTNLASSLTHISCTATIMSLRVLVVRLCDVLLLTYFRSKLKIWQAYWYGDELWSHGGRQGTQCGAPTSRVSLYCGLLVNK